MRPISVLLSTAAAFVVPVLGGSSFGGVNHYYLANLPAATRDNVVTKIVNGNARVIRTFVGARPYSSEKGNPISTSPDVEGPLGTFDDSQLDKYDDLLWSIYTISQGKTKVLLSLHNANNLNAVGQPSCDVYCQYLNAHGMGWQQFYNSNNQEIRNFLKKRYQHILNGYKSKRWPGKTWGQLSDVIFAIDLENEPLVSDQTTSFTDWICDMATYLRSSAVGLSSNIGISSGGLRGADYSDRPPATSGQNWPQEAFDCAALDIIAFHGYFKASGTCSTCGADQPWYDLFIQQAWGGILRQKALDKNKLLMVEEWSYTNDQAHLGTEQLGEIWAQGHALNVRGIPWIYWDVMSGADGYCDSDGCKEISVDGGGGSPWSVLSGVMGEALTSSTEFDWSRFFPTNPNAVLLAIPDNGKSVSGGSSSCTWGCAGWDCSASQPCSGDLQCTSGVCKTCSWGCLGWSCSASQPCQGDNECVNGVCKACSWGCKGWQCSAQAPCKDSNECSGGVCKACSWGCKGWSCSASQPCQGQLECVSGVCSACSWGCLGWSCSASTPCKAVNECSGNVCKACDWGCPGWSCSASQPCQGDLECKSGQCGACTWGCLGWTCSATSPCKGQNECVSGTCKPCSWGCLGWTCSASSPCKSSYSCVNGVCRLP
ncbi:hypothetical protein GQ53DRAFT_740463 [Thozetella sp. PMI_491]|nr:hypothetical protein GQ53DRAFT_740463 [Thozetella sp. PMI_491]